MYRATLFDGRYPGDVGDARWTLALHEHWLRVWQGHEAIRDLHYYAPLSDVLGTSEAFLVQGHIHAVLRVLGVSIEHSWAAAQVLFFVLGASILTELGVHDMILLTNTHHTLVGLDGYGLSIVGEQPITPVGEG